MNTEVLMEPVTQIVSLKCYREDILSALTLAKAVVEKRTTIPILWAVRITAGSSHAVLVGTDLDFWVRHPFATNGDASDFDIVVSHASLLALVKAAPKGCEVALSYDRAEEPSEGYKLTLRIGGQTATLDTFPVGDWPDDYVMGNTKTTFTVDTAAFAKDLRTTRTAVSTEETRHCLNGVFLREAVGKLWMVATDGHRMVKTLHGELPAKEGVTDVIVPTKMVNAWLALLEVKRGLKTGKAAEPARAQVTVTDKRALRLEVGGVVIEGTSIDGSFPDYERIIPHAKHMPLTITVNRKDMIEATKRVAAIRRERGAAVNLIVENSERIELEVKHPEAGATSVGLDAVVEGAPEKCVGAAGLKIGFSAAYVVSLLDVLDCDRVTFLLQDAVSPILINGYGREAVTMVLAPWPTRNK